MDLRCFCTLDLTNTYAKKDREDMLKGECFGISDARIVAHKQAARVVVWIYILTLQEM